MKRKHRWMKPDGSHGTTDIPENHDVQVGDEFVVSPTFKRKNMRGQHAKILEVKEGNKALVQLDENNKFWMDLNQLHKILKKMGKKK